VPDFMGCGGVYDAGTFTIGSSGHLDQEISGNDDYLEDSALNILLWRFSLILSYLQFSGCFGAKAS
jgi:hypothetical protein